VLTKNSYTTRSVHGRAAQAEERDRLWARWREIHEKLDAHVRRRPTETAVVILESIDRP
jgi:F420H(2)-dependent quinone reductase